MKRYSLIFLMLICTIQLSAQTDYKPSAANLEAREWFENAKFGMFVHWGVYSVLGDGEWVMNNQNISISAYDKLPGFFNPQEFDADQWVKLAKDAGMKYITITSRHHDGFSMFDTEASDFNIVDATPYKKDVLKSLAEACSKEGIKLFFYYSLLDWRHDDYFPKGRTGNGIEGRAASGEWEKYIEFMKVQLTELLTNYGDIAGIWFDGHWDQKEWDGKKFGAVKVDWHYDEIYTLIHELQPQCLIGNNHHLAPIAGEDFQMFEKDLPGKNTTGWGTSSDDIGSLPKEVCETINGSWGFNLQDKKHKSEKELIQYLINAAGYGSNLLLNVGPMPNGKIQEEHVNSLKSIGKWLEKYGETIYGSRQGPVPPSSEMVSTQKDEKIYLHLLNEQIETYLIPDFEGKIRKMSFYDSGKKVTHKVDEYGLAFNVPKEERNNIDTIIVLELR
ncbi:alpha-L-fucosidase [Lutimonas zeaxanthinifaciens]|uniref:alpha-L-fucosidase n=1 Tax=Lutimonas zeaxanthinifaciens TaxID=3060215 RepID=UPI00265CB7B6|nr:alpha-L-fucosidase [Lutimonas sp. YSD2104]WKK65872.1 alpha-L-fucosidase [Lutimonas sp. YSD2104]